MNELNGTARLSILVVGLFVLGYTYAMVDKIRHPADPAIWQKYGVK